MQNSIDFFAQARATLALSTCTSELRPHSSLFSKLRTSGHALRFNIHALDQTLSKCTSSLARTLRLTCPSLFLHTAERPLVPLQC